jgi:hypothetical protein
MRTVNLDTLVSVGRPPWEPVAAAQDVDVWDKYDFPLHGTYSLGDEVVVFTLVTIVGSRSLWAYVPVPPERREAVAEPRFDTKAEFDAFLANCFAGREAVFAAAENFVITSKSDGILIPPGRHGLLAAGARWYALRAATLAGERAQQVAEQTADDADPDSLLQAAHSALADLPA